MIAVSRIYRNIRLSELQSVLRLATVQHAEKAASKMITEGRLKGIIDQTEGVLSFEEEGDGNEAEGSGAYRAAGGGVDAHIAQMCQQVDECSVRGEHLLMALQQQQHQQ